MLEGLLRPFEVTALTCVDTLIGRTPPFFAPKQLTTLLSKLSTAFCVGAVTRNLDSGSFSNSWVMITTIVCVFPVPGEPHMNVNECFIEAMSASL